LEKHTHGYAFALDYVTIQIYTIFPVLFVATAILYFVKIQIRNCGLKLMRNLTSGSSHLFGSLAEFTATGYCDSR